MSNEVQGSQEQAAILNRLRSAQGHLGAVTRMVEAGECCEEVLHQLDAVAAALRAVGSALWSCEFEKCDQTM